MSTSLCSALGGKPIQPLRSIVHQLRAVKSGAEAMLMRSAGKISGRAYNIAIGQHFISEKDLCAFLEYEFIRGGCDGSAYVPVVAGGRNALSIHYTSNDCLLRWAAVTSSVFSSSLSIRDGDLVLVDAGGVKSVAPAHIEPLN